MSMKLKKDLQPDFVDAVNYSMKLVLTNDSSFAKNMTITDTLFTSLTDEVVSKGRLITSISSHVRRTIIEQIGKVETDVMKAQNWKAETASDKSKDAKKKRKSKSSKQSTPLDSNNFKLDIATDWAREISLSSYDSPEEEEVKPSK